MLEPKDCQVILNPADCTLQQGCTVQHFTGSEAPPEKRARVGPTIVAPPGEATGIDLPGVAGPAAAAAAAAARPSTSEIHN